MHFLDYNFDWLFRTTGLLFAQTAGELPELPGILNNPAIKERALKLVDILQDQKFQQSALSISNNPNHTAYFISLAVMSILYGIFRYRLLSKLPKWWMKLLGRLVFVFVYPALLFALSYAFYREPLIEVLVRLKDVV